MDSQILRLWGIESPISNPDGLPPDGLPDYVGPREDEALSRMLYAVEAGLRCVLVHGPQGVGKTRLARRFVLDLPTDRLGSVYLDLADRSPHEFLSALGVALGAVHDLTEPASRLWRQIVDRLAGWHAMHRPTVILLDQLECATRETVQMISRLLRLHGVLLTVQLVLNDDPIADDMLRTSGLGDLVDLEAPLTPLSEEEAGEFLAMCFPRRAGDPPLVTPAACREMHRRTGGIHHRLRRLAELCLAAGTLQGATQIDLPLVESAASEIPLAQRWRDARAGQRNRAA